VLVVALGAPSIAAAGIEAESITLTVPPGTRSIGMGFTGVSDTRDIANFFHNPAVVSFAEGIGLTGGLDNWQGDINQFNFGLSTTGDINNRFRLGGGLFHSRAESRVRVGTSALKVATNESFMTAVIAGAWQGSARFQIGVGAATRWSTSNSFETDALFDAGTVVTGTLLDSNSVRFGYAVGISGRNIGGGAAVVKDTSGVTSADIEETISFGITLRVAWQREEKTPLSFSVNVDANEEFESPAVGGELTVLETVSLRGGYRDSFLRGTHASSVGIGAGHRFGFYMLRFDYAFAEARDGSWHFNAMGTTMSFDL
jgi:hypothetical protein